METILLAEPIDDLRYFLKRELTRKYRVIECSDGDEALNKLISEKPAAMIISLMLPSKDGLCVLREAGNLKPSVIICTTTYIPQYWEEIARELNIGYVFRLPCNVHAVVYELERLLNESRDSIPYGMIAFLEKHLLVLGFLPKSRVYKRMLVCIPRFAQDMDQSLTNELYVDTAKICGASGWKTIESSLRRGIWQAKARADPKVWEQYFGCADICPTCEVFLQKLAQLLKEEYPYL